MTRRKHTAAVSAFDRTAAPLQRKRPALRTGHARRCPR